MQRNVENDCTELHRWASLRHRFYFPFDDREIPLNGIYILFERNEHAHGTDRVVRVGTHTGQSQLRSRLKQHFLVENKDRSIFRKNIGRALLRKKHDPFLVDWEIDLTPLAARVEHNHRIDEQRRREIEREVSSYIQNNFSFVVLQVDSKEQRLRLESRMISTVSRCPICKPSKDWLGSYSTKEKIRKSGLWLVNELYKEPLDKQDFALLTHANLTTSTQDPRRNQKRRAELKVTSS